MLSTGTQAPAASSDGGRKRCRVDGKDLVTMRLQPELIDQAADAMTRAFGCVTEAAGVMFVTAKEARRTHWRMEHDDPGERTTFAPPPPHRHRHRHRHRHHHHDHHHDQHSSSWPSLLVHLLGRQHRLHS
jgi:G3E family GTPase